MMLSKKASKKKIVPKIIIKFFIPLTPIGLMDFGDKTNLIVEIMKVDKKT